MANFVDGPDTCGHQRNDICRTTNMFLMEKECQKNRFPTHWKCENGVYCAGLSKMGLAGVSMDAKAIANDINIVVRGSKEKIE
ncbi:unnamed protein product [Ilex paraguariensis]|uniref:Uncharacterized protein n=1 Tax=Ilex paraguariensis TaxID=185542 RepID=A0ABC8QY88_9AQUA